MAKKQAWYEKPEPKFRASRSPEEYAAVAAALEALPSDHPARHAFVGGADTIRLTHLVSGYPAVRDALVAAYVEACGRAISSIGAYRP